MERRKITSGTPEDINETIESIELTGLSDLGQVVDFTTDANAVATVDHDLEKIPIGYFVLLQSQVGSLIKASPEVWTAKKVKFQSSAANMAFRVLLVRK